MKRQQPMFSLRKSVMRILVIGMAALLLLAGALLVFTMSQYHRQVDEHDVDLLQNANGELNRAYDNMRRAVNAIYSTGAFFEGSPADESGAENTTRIYNTLNMPKTLAARGAIPYGSTRAASMRISGSPGFEFGTAFFEMVRMNRQEG